MRSCAAPVRDSTIDYDRCVLRTNQPKKAGLRQRRPDVLAGYAAFPAGSGRAHLVQDSAAWPEQQANWQRSLYVQTYEGGWLEDLRAEVLAAARGRCLLCGVSQPKTIDHFLPKESWPALAIFVLNLVAVCADCNRNKGSIANAAAGEQFVHPYFDAVPVNEQFLTCTPFSGGVLSPTFSITAHPGMDADLRGRLAWQFQTLELDDLYRTEAILAFGERKDDWAETVADGWPALIGQISREYRAASRPNGPNMWKPAFLKGLIDSPDFAADPAACLA